MNRRVLRRFVIIAAAATFIAFSGWTLLHVFVSEAPGDFHTREGDIRLGDGRYDEALAAFDKALAEMPNHRGALMGRALVFIQTGRLADASAALTGLIAFLESTLKPDDPTGRATLAAAYANRGIVRDRAGEYRKALDDYVKALKIDEETLSGPSLFDRILYGNPRPPTVRKRAVYIARQLALPPEQRLLRVPELDAEQRMYKP